jgi:hypothetical protein
MPSPRHTLHGKRASSCGTYGFRRISVPHASDSHKSCLGRPASLHYDCRLRAATPWVFAALIPLTAPFQAIAGAPPPDTEFRVSEFVADPPILDLLRVPGQQVQTVVYDTPGKTNQLLTATSLSPGTIWQPGVVTLMTNSFRIMAPVPATDPVRFYRAHRL